MQSTWKNIFVESSFIPDTNNLEDLLFTRIQKKVQKANNLRLFVYSLACLVSTIILFISVKYVVTDFYNSGAYSYFHLIISEDAATLLKFSKEILYALFESLPLMSITLLFGLLFVFMILLNRMILSLKICYVFKN